MNGIFYFSSTGNTLYIAEQIKAELGGEIRFIPKFTGDVNTYDKMIIVSPILIPHILNYEIVQFFVKNCDY